MARVRQYNKDGTYSEYNVPAAEGQVEPQRRDDGEPDYGYNDNDNKNDGYASAYPPEHRSYGTRTVYNYGPLRATTSHDEDPRYLTVNHDGEPSYTMMYKDGLFYPVVHNNPGDGTTPYNSYPVLDYHHTVDDDSNHLATDTVLDKYETDMKRFWQLGAEYKRAYTRLMGQFAGEGSLGHDIAGEYGDVVQHLATNEGMIPHACPFLTIANETDSSLPAHKRIGLFLNDPAVRDDVPKWSPADLESHQLCEPSSSKATPTTDNDQTSKAAKPHESEKGVVAEKAKDTPAVSPGDDDGPLPGSSKTTTSVEDSGGREEPAVVTKAAKKEMVEVAIDGGKKKGKKKATEAPALPVDVDAASTKVEEKKTTKGGKSAGVKAVVKVPVENGVNDGAKGKGKGVQKKKKDTPGPGPTPGVDEAPVAGPSNVDINTGDALQPEVKNKKRKRGEEEEEEPEPEQVESSKENTKGLRRSRRPKMPRKHIFAF